MKIYSLSILVAVFALLTPARAQEAPIAGRKESRAEVVLKNHADRLREALDDFTTQLRSETDARSNLTSALKKLQLSSATFGSPSTDKKPDSAPAAASNDFEAFKSKLKKVVLYQQPDGTPALLQAPGLQPITYYLIEEDIALDELELTLYHEQSVALTAAPKGSERPAGAQFATSFTSADPTTSRSVQVPLRAQTEFDKIVRWVPGSTLRYCILKWSFDHDDKKYELVKANMHAACADWAKVCNIRFEHVESLDATPRGTVFPLGADGKRQVLFVVAQHDIGGAFAQSFFPNDSMDKRLLLVDPAQYFSPGSIDQTGILRHEIGHILGFRHEHISPDAPVWSSSFCAMESPASSVAITAYERASVMHYPCVDRLNKDPLPANLKLEITQLDTIGAQAVYGPPGGVPTGNLVFRNFDPTN